MSAPVDVLAVMDEFVSVVGDEFGDAPALRLREARAAVAELIEEVSDTLATHPAAGSYPDGPCIERQQRGLLRAAHARVGGAA